MPDEHWNGQPHPKALHDIRSARRSAGWTHGYDSLHRCLVLVLAFGLAALPVRCMRSEGEPASGIIIAAFVVLFVGLCLLLYFVLLPTWIPTWLHVRFTLKTPISRKEARSMTFLFDGSMNRKWVWFGPLRRLPEYSRRSYIFLVANEVARKNLMPIPFPLMHLGIGDEAARR